MDLKEIERLIAQHKHWHHRIELAPGLSTPGVSDSHGLLRYLEDLGLPSDFHGARVLDLGCRDGFFSFELERRGAEVVPVDYVEPSSTGFPIAASILGSNLVYVVDNVYRLDRDRHGSFDHVLFLGLLYHLRNPMFALDHIRSVLNDGGTLWVETQLATDPEALENDRPLWQFFPRDELNNDDTNMWGPNMAGLRSVLEDCEFEILEVKVVGGRGLAKARAVNDERLKFFRELDTAVIRLSS